MAESTKLIPFFAKINPKVLHDWRETINKNERVKDRLEESLRDNAEKHRRGK